MIIYPVADMPALRAQILGCEIASWSATLRDLRKLNHVAQQKPLANFGVIRNIQALQSRYPRFEKKHVRSVHPQLALATVYGTRIKVL